MLHHSSPRRTARGVLVALLLGLGACGGEQGPDPDPDPNDPGTHAPDPIAVSAQADVGRAAEGVIDSLGGTLTAVGADGTQYLLSVPPGALAFEQSIRMTPLASVGGLPLGGGLAAGVQLEPDGLWLLRPATLYATTARPVSADGAVGFAYEGDGREFHLTPVRAAGALVTLELLHFSGHGVATGTKAEIAAQASHAPTAVSAQVAQDVAVAEHGGPPPTEQTMGERLETSYRAIQPTVTSALAGTSLVALHNAVQSMLTLAHYSAILGDPNGTKYAEEAMHLLWELNRRILEDAWSRCVHRNDVGAINDILAVNRMHQLAGSADPLPQKYTDGCLRFELDFDSRVEADATVEGTHSVTVATAAVDDLVLTFNGGSGALDGRAPNRNLGVSATVSGNPCTLQYGGLTDGLFEVARLDFEMESAGVSEVGYGQKATIKNIRMGYVPGQPSETQTMICPNTPPIPSQSQMWQAYFSVMHQDEVLFPPAFYGTLLSRGSGEHFAFRSWNRPRDCSNEGTVASCSEATTITIYHRPRAE